MARQVNWRKVSYDYVWRATPHEMFGLDCKLEVHAGVRHSSLVNRNARLIVSTKDSNGKYVATYEREFYSNWHAKEIIDSLLHLMRSKEDKSDNQSWFITNLSSIAVPTEPLGPNTASWATPAGYPA